jgi:hypothetical protein
METVSTPTPVSWWQTIPGMLTALAGLLAAVTALIVALKDFTHTIESTDPAPKVDISKPTQNPGDQTGTKIQPPTIQVKPPEVRSISGRWRDNLGFVSDIQQTGTSFTFTVQGGTSCLFRPFVSRGSGSIRGRDIESNYQSSLGSQGKCTGTISSDGYTMDSQCYDSICGQFTSSSNKE